MVWRGVVLCSIVSCGVIPTLRLVEHERGEGIAEEAYLPSMRVSAEGEWDIGFGDDLSSPMRWVVGEEDFDRRKAIRR